MIWMCPEDCLNKIAEMPNEYTNTMDKNVMGEKAESRLRFPGNRKRGNGWVRTFVVVRE